MEKLSATQKKISLVLKIIVIFSAVIGTILSYMANANLFMSGSRTFMYFTIQSNIAIAIISAVGISYMLKDKNEDVWQIVHFVGAVSITLTGIVFCFVLAPTMGMAAWNPKNILTHVVVPIAAVIDFFVAGQSYSISKKKVVFVIIPPVLYAIYTGIGYALNWQFSEGENYPYFFLNWGSPAGAFGFSKELPFMGCGWWIVAIFLFLMGVGNLYLWISKLLKKNK